MRSILHGPLNDLEIAGRAISEMAAAGQFPGFYKSWQGPLLNRTDGGEGIVGLAPEAIARRNESIRKAQKDKPKSADHIAALKRGRIKRRARSAAFVGLSLKAYEALPRNERVRMRRVKQKTIGDAHRESRAAR